MLCTHTSSLFDYYLYLYHLVINVGIGISMFQTNCVPVSSDNNILWIYLGWLAFFVSMEVFMFVATTFNALSPSTSRQGSYIQLQFIFYLL